MSELPRTDDPPLDAERVEEAFAEFGERVRELESVASELRAELRALRSERAVPAPLDDEEAWPADAGATPAGSPDWVAAVPPPLTLPSAAPRLVAEAAFLVLVALLAGLADLSAVWIAVVMLAAWALVGFLRVGGGGEARPLAPRRGSRSASGRGRPRARHDRPLEHAGRAGDRDRDAGRLGVADHGRLAAAAAGGVCRHRGDDGAHGGNGTAAAVLAAASGRDDAGPLGGVRTVAVAAAAAALALPAAAGLRPAPVLELPAGFAGELYATGLERPTALAFGPDGLLYATQETGEVVAVGRGSSAPRVLARGFRTPLGLAWDGETLFVSAQGSLHRLVVRGRRVVSRRAIVTGLPFGRHQQDTVAVGPDGRIYLGSGSTCDACREKNRRSAAILSVEPDGTNLRVEARGLRNPYGLAFRPGTARLYVSDNGRDDLGDNEPAETIVLFRRGADYGWPDCWASWRQRRLAGRCGGVTPPVAYLEPHSSANSLVFWRGEPRRRRVGPVPERAVGAQARPRRRRERPHDDAGDGLRASARPRGRATGRRAPGGRLGPRRDLPDHEALSRRGEATGDAALVGG